MATFLDGPHQPLQAVFGRLPRGGIAGRQEPLNGQRRLLDPVPPAVNMLRSLQPIETPPGFGSFEDSQVAIRQKYFSRAVHRVLFARMILVTEPERYPASV